MINLQRFINPIDHEYMKRSYAHLVNEKNITELSRFKLKKIFKDEDKVLVDKYLHNVLNIWAAQNYKNDEHSYPHFKKLVKKVGINLNEVEKHDMLLLEERSFSLFRHIKILEVDIDLRPGETCGAKFVNATVNELTKMLKQLEKGDLMITNERIILKGQTETLMFEYKDMKNQKFENYGFQFNIGSKKYVVRIHDQITLNNTLQNLFSKI